MAQQSSMVFISSLSHAVGYPGASVYAGTKDGVAAYARCLQKPLARKGVRVLTVFPGPIRTDHAQLHAPEGADSSRRMEPDKLAAIILKASKTNKRVCYPGGGAKLAALIGTLAPVFATRQMPSPTAFGSWSKLIAYANVGKRSP